MTLSAAIIVVDDADHLDACLTSVRALVDEIVVVDAGSTDASTDAAIAIARRHEAVVDHLPWHGDVTTLRNRSLELATADWVFSLDADEHLTIELDDAHALVVEPDRCVGYRVRSVPRPGWTPSYELRLWRNRPDVRFRGHSRESILPDLQAIAESEDLRIETVDGIAIRHDGPEGDRAGTRARDESLLRAELAQHPDRPFAYARLARLHEAAGDDRSAVDTWKRGIEVARVRGRPHPDDTLLYLDLIQHLLARGTLDDDLGALVAEARERVDVTPTLELAAASLAFATGRPRDAIEPLEWLVALDRDAVGATGSSYDERVFGEWAWGLLGLCRFALQDDAAAAVAFRRAEELAPGDSSYGVRRRLAEARAATPAC